MRIIFSYFGETKMNSTFSKLVSVSIVTVMLVSMFLVCVVQADDSFEHTEALGLLSTSSAHYVGSTGGRFIAPIVPLTSAMIEAEGYIEISDHIGLEAIKDNLDGKYYLSDDIYLYDVEWIPIGDNINPFRGTFDGQGYVIHNLIITGNHYYTGLFGYVEKSTIINVGLAETNICVSYLYSSYYYNFYVGGICGYASGSVISNCYNSGDVAGYSASHGHNSCVGGICGSVSDVVISNCYNAGNISVSASSQSFSCVGGICGSVSDVVISNCYNAGNIDVHSPSTGSYAGGICGQTAEWTDVVISNCYNAGNIDTYSLGADAGGICGSSWASKNVVISNCYNIGNIVAYSSTYNAISSYAFCAGGICGCAQKSSVISNCYNAGNIDASTTYYSYYPYASCAGGICGCVLDSSTISNCYWRIESIQIVNDSPQEPKRGVGYGTYPTTGLSSLDMMYESSYGDWDFDDVWFIVDGKGYPVLRWELPPDVTEKELENFFIDINVYSISVIDQDTFTPVKNAVVTINGQECSPSDDKGIVKCSFFGTNYIHISADGYRDNIQYYSIRPRDSRLVFIERDKSDGLPYFSLVADTTKEIDLRNQIRRFTEGDTTVLNLVVVGEWCGHSAGSYILYQDSIQDGPTGKYVVAAGYTIPGISNAAIFTFAPGLTLNPEYPVKLKMVSTDGTESALIDIDLVISKKNVGSPPVDNAYNIDRNSDYSFSFMRILSAVFPSTSEEPFVKFFPIDFSITDVLDVPVEIKSEQDADGYTIKALIGFSKQTRDLLSKEKEPEFETLKSDVLRAKDFLQDRDKLFKYWDEKLEKGLKLESSLKATCKTIGFFEIKLDNNGKFVKGIGGVLVQFEGSYTFAGPFPPAPYMYYELKLGVGSDLKFDIGFREINDNLEFGVEGTFKLIVPKVVLGAGVGVRGLASFGIEGEASLEIEYGGSMTAPSGGTPIWKGTIKASGSAKLQIAFVVNAKWTLAKGSWPLWDSSSRDRTMAFFGDELDDLSYEFSLVSRDYVEKTTDWNGVVSRPNLLLRDFNVEQDVVHELQDWILPNSIPQIAKVGDNLVMLFQYDDKDRALGDHTILMYSIYDGGVWSEPQPVWVSDTGDVFFNCVVVNDELYVVWQKQNAKITQTDDAMALLKEVSENSEIAFVKFNKATGLFENQIFITSNDVLDMYPTVAVNGEEISVVWVSNSDSDALGMSGTYSIMKSVSDGEGFSVPITLYETEDFIAELSAGYVNGKLEVAFTAGDSADLTAAYIVDSTGASRFTGEGSVSALKFNDEHFYYHSLGSVYTYDPTTRIAKRVEVPDVFAVSSSYKIVDTDNKQALVWSSFNGDNYSIQASLRLDNGVWTLPITLLTVDDDTVISYMDVVVSDSGTWNVIMNTALRDLFDADEESGIGLIDRDATPKSSLVFAVITPKTDTELTYVYANQRDVVGAVQPVSFSVKNLGESVVESLRVDVLGDAKSYFSQVISCYIAPGAEKDFTVNIDVADMNSVTDLTVFVASVDELDTRNNFVVIQLGQVDVSIVDLTQYKIGNNVIVTAQIANKAKTPAYGVVVKVIENSLDGNVIDVKEIEVLDNGQDYVCVFKIDTGELVYDEFDRKVLFLQVETLEPNYHDYDNTEVVILYKVVDYEVSDVPLEQIILVPVESVEIEVDIVALVLDDPEHSTAQLVAKVFPLDATNRGVRWVVEDADIVLVDSFGVVHALRVGETLITAITQDGEFVDTVKVVVTAAEMVRYHLEVVAGIGGNVLTDFSGQYVAGDIVGLSAIADGDYVFKQWVSSSGGGFDNAFSASTAFIMPESDVTLTAIFEAVKTFDVSFNVDGVLTVVVVKFGEKVIQPIDPVKAGYMFDGWRVGSVKGVLYDFDMMVTQDTLLYASWSAVGDVNGDGFVDFLDVTRLLRYLWEVPDSTLFNVVNADTNGDGVVDFLDVTRLLRYLWEVDPSPMGPNPLVTPAFLFMPFEFNEPAITVSDEVCQAGDEVTLIVSLTNNPGIASFSLTLEYPDELTFIEAKAGDIISSNFRASADSGVVVVSATSENGVDVASGTILFTVSFTVSEKANAGCRRYKPWFVQVC